MRIINKVLTESLFKMCKEELQSKLHERCWSTSFLTWAPFLHIGITGSCLSTKVSDKLSDLIHKQIKSYLPKNDRIEFLFHLWQPESGIAGHDDGHVKCGATIYLNDNWNPDAGGWFVWGDEETKQSGIYKALVPTRNMMVLNDNEEMHYVTPVSPICPDMRFSIQIWCHDMDVTIDNIKKSQEMLNESTKLDAPLPKGEKTKT